LALPSLQQRPLASLSLTQSPRSRNIRCRAFDDRSPPQTPRESASDAQPDKHCLGYLLNRRCDLGQRFPRPSSHEAAAADFRFSKAAHQRAMNRFVFICPTSGVAVLTDKIATPATVQQLKTYPVRVYCPACRADHRITFSECKSFPLRRRIPINVSAS
jgi:hypothetical protein